MVSVPGSLAVHRVDSSLPVVAFCCTDVVSIAVLIATILSMGRMCLVSAVVEGHTSQLLLLLVHCCEFLRPPPLGVGGVWSHWDMLFNGGDEVVHEVFEDVIELVNCSYNGHYTTLLNLGHKHLIKGIPVNLLEVPIRMVGCHHC